MLRPGRQHPAGPLRPQLRHAAHGKPASDRKKTESYLNPRDHRAGLLVRNLPAEPGLSCVWTLWDKEPPGRRFEAPCAAEVIDDLLSGVGTKVSVTGSAARRSRRCWRPRSRCADLLIAGMGDSDRLRRGQPGRPVMLSDKGFCYRRLLAGSLEFFRPSRREFRGARDCSPATSAREPADPAKAEWARAGADWMSPGSTARFTVTRCAPPWRWRRRPARRGDLLPLACTGALIDDGLLGSQSIRDFAKAGEQAAGSRESRHQRAAAGRPAGRYQGRA